MKKFYPSVLFFFVIISQAFSQTYTVGTGTTVNTTTGYPSPYGNYYQGSKHQFLIRASELTGLGMTAGKITSLAFNVKTPSGGTMSNFTISMKMSTTSATEVLTTTYATGLTQVYGPVNYTDVTGWNTHVFSNPFCWDGASNIIVETCFYSPTYTNNALVYNTTNSFNCDNYIYNDAASQCGGTTAGTVDKVRPNMKLTRVPSTPDIVATSLVTPIKIVNINSSNTVSFVFTNQSCAGTTFTTANVSYQWNSNAPVTASWTGSLAPNASATYTFATPLIATPTGFNTLKVWVNNPNGLSPDGNINNDTITSNIYVETPVAAPPVTLSSTDYWMTFPANPDGATSTAYQLVINSVYCAKGSVIFPQLANNTTNFTITPGTSLTLTIPSTIAAQTIYHGAVDAIEGKGFHIISDSAISVYMVPYQGQTVDGEFILPTSMLGTSYVVSSRSYGGISPAYVTVGATQNGTTVNVCNNVTGACATVTLNAGQTYKIGASVNNCVGEDEITSSEDDCYQLTGTRVVADKPVFALGHADCANIGYCGACDQVMAESLPLNLCGTKYVLAQPIKRNDPSTSNCRIGMVAPAIISVADFVEIVGPIGTTGTISRESGMTGGSSASFTIPNNGKFGYGYYWYLNPKGIGSEAYGECNLIINTSNPVQVVQYNHGWQTDNQNFTDPEQILIFPETFWQSSYIFSSSSTATSQNNVVIVVDNTNTGAGVPISNFQIDGAAVPGTGWQAISTGNYKFIRRSLSIGGASHTIINTKGYKFGIYVNAVGAAESYTTQLGGSPIRLPYPSPCTYAIPIRLLYIVGTNTSEGNLVKWGSATELASSDYQIERSIGNNNNFEVVGHIQGRSNNSRVVEYSFLDRNAPKGISYYRIRTKDVSDNESVSEIISVKPNFSNIADNASVNYVPLSGLVNINYFTENKGNIGVSIYNSMGSVVSFQSFPAQLGPNTFQMNTSNLEKGVYFVSISQNSTYFNKKIIIY